MLEIRCSESEAVMRMRGMPSICIAAQRVCAAGGANIRLVESFFATPAKKLRQLSTISMARRVISVTRSAVGFVEGDAARIAIRISESVFMRRSSRL